MADLLLSLPVRMIYEIIGFPKDEEQTQRFAARAKRILVGPQRNLEKARIRMESAFGPRRSPTTTRSTCSNGVAQKAPPAMI